MADIPYSKTWVYDGKFNEMIAKADEVVIVDNSHMFIEGKEERELKSIINLEEIREFNRTITIKKNQEWDKYWNHGYPLIRWFHEGNLIVEARIKNGLAITLEGRLGADAFLTKDSSIALLSWLIEHKIEDPDGDFVHQLKKLKSQQGGSGNPDKPDPRP